MLPKYVSVINSGLIYVEELCVQYLWFITMGEFPILDWKWDCDHSGAITTYDCPTAIPHCIMQ